MSETHFVYEVGEDKAEVKLCDDGWAWRCWSCGWHGVGLFSSEGAHRELAGHECRPTNGLTVAELAQR